MTLLVNVNLTIRMLNISCSEILPVIMMICGMREFMELALGHLKTVNSLVMYVIILAGKIFGGTRNILQYAENTLTDSLVPARWVLRVW